MVGICAPKSKLHGNAVAASTYYFLKRGFQSYLWHLVWRVIKVAWRQTVPPSDVGFSIDLSCCIASRLEFAALFRWHWY